MSLSELLKKNAEKSLSFKENSDDYKETITDEITILSVKPLYKKDKDGKTLEKDKDGKPIPSGKLKIVTEDAGTLFAFPSVFPSFSLNGLEFQIQIPKKGLKATVSLYQADAEDKDGDKCLNVTSLQFDEETFAFYSPTKALFNR
jgi:hypothetical protein